MAEDDYKFIHVSLISIHHCLPWLRSLFFTCIVSLSGCAATAALAGPASFCHPSVSRSSNFKCKSSSTVDKENPLIRIAFFLPSSLRRGDRAWEPFLVANARTAASNPFRSPIWDEKRKSGEFQGANHPLPQSVGVSEIKEPWCCVYLSIDKCAVGRQRRWFR